MTTTQPAVLLEHYLKRLKLLTVLREYWAAYRPGPFHFPGRRPDRPVSPRTVQMVCERALAASGLGKHVHMHTLRHNADCRIMPTGICRVTRDPADRAFFAC